MSSELYDFVGYDSAQTMEEATEVFEGEAEEELYAGDEREMMILTFGYMVEVVMAEINYRANNNIIRTCDEETLYMKAEGRCVTRNEAKKAKVTEKFSIGEVIARDIVIPKGTRVTQEGTLFFKTVEETRIPAGETEVSIQCEASEGGTEYNDAAVGTLTVLAETIPYITSVTNTTASAGGVDQEDLEGFRDRVINAPKGYSTAGADLAYIAKVKEVDSRIVDVCPIYDEDEEILKLYVLCEDGSLPDEALIQEIKEHIYQKYIKASTDKVEILAAVKKNYSITCTYKISAGDSDRASEIQDDVDAAVQKYIESMCSQMGTTINPEILKRDIYVAGAATATVTLPAYTELELYEVATCTEKTVTYGGIL